MLACFDAEDKPLMKSGAYKFILITIPWCLKDQMGAKNLKREKF